MQLYTVKEVSKILKLHTNKVYEKIHAGEITAVRLGESDGAHIRISDEALKAFLRPHPINNANAKE